MTRADLLKRITVRSHVARVGSCLFGSRGKIRPGGNRR